jgi:hypothetical protein
MALTAVKLANDRQPMRTLTAMTAQTEMMGVPVFLFIRPRKPLSGKAPSLEKANTVREFACKAVCTVNAATRLGLSACCWCSANSETIWPKTAIIDAPDKRPNGNRACATHTEVHDT